MSPSPNRSPTICAVVSLSPTRSSAAERLSSGRQGRQVASREIRGYSEPESQTLANRTGEAQLLDQERDEAVLDGEELVRPVGRLAEGHDPGGADDRPQGLQVRVATTGLRGGERDRPRPQPGDRRPGWAASGESWRLRDSRGPDRVDRRPATSRDELSDGRERPTKERSAR